MNPLMKLAAWIAGGLALGWLVTAGVALTLPAGHPPSAFYVGGAVVLASFVMAPIGAVAALAGLWRLRRQGAGTPAQAVATLVLNLLFLGVAVTLWLWIRWEAARR